jgi:hypothetical protein
MLLSTSRSVLEETVSNNKNIFNNQVYAKIAGFALLVGTVSSAWFTRMVKLYPSVSVGYFLIIAISSIVAFGYYANLMKSENKNNFASWGAWVLAFGIPIYRVANTIIEYAAQNVDIGSNILFFIPTFIYGIAYVIFGVGQNNKKTLTGKSTIPLAVTSIVVGLTYLSILGLRLAILFNLVFYCLFIYLLYPRLPGKNKPTLKMD